MKLFDHFKSLIDIAILAFFLVNICLWMFIGNLRDEAFLVAVVATPIWFWMTIRTIRKERERGGQIMTVIGLLILASLAGIRAGEKEIERTRRGKK